MNQKTSNVISRRLFGIIWAIMIFPSMLAFSAVAVAGIFAPYVTFPVGSRPEALAIGDVKGDGRNDVVITTSFNNNANDYKLFVFLQNSSGNWTRLSYIQRMAHITIGLEQSPW